MNNGRGIKKRDVERLAITTENLPEVQSQIMAKAHHLTHKIIGLKMADAIKGAQAHYAIEWGWNDPGSLNTAICEAMREIRDAKARAVSEALGGVFVTTQELATGQGSKLREPAQPSLFTETGPLKGATLTKAQATPIVKAEIERAPKINLSALVRAEAKRLKPKRGDTISLTFESVSWAEKAQRVAHKALKPIGLSVKTTLEGKTLKITRVK